MRKIPASTEELLDIIKGHGVIAGSYPLWLYDEGATWTPSDIDIFSFSEISFGYITAKLIVRGYKTAHTSNWATTYFNPAGLKVQLVRPLPDRDDMETVVSRFDISVSQFALLTPTEVWGTDIAKYDVDREQCRIVRGHNNSLVDLQRLMKYNAKGYRVLPSDLIYVLEKWDSNPALIEKYLKMSRVANSEYP